MAIKRYKIGTTIHLTCEVRDVNDALIAPDGGVLVYVEDISGTVVVNGSSMNADGVGLYSYDWLTQVGTNTAGIYKVTCKATNGGKPAIEVDDSALELF